MSLYVDVSALRDRELTGIGQTALNVVACALRDSDDDIRFLAGASELPRPLVEDVVGSSNGSVLNLYLSSGRAQWPTIDPDAHNGAIFLHRVHLERCFDKQAMLLYDLTPLVVPSYHSSETIHEFIQSYRRELDSVDHIVAISDATLADLTTYFPEYLDKTSVSLCGITEAAFLPSSLVLPSVLADRPYILSLGTLEPRKNNVLTLEMLSHDRNLLRHYRFIFVGRFGWGDRTEAVLAELGLEDAVDAGDIVFTGFVNEAVKKTLIQQSAALLYPSRYEGFGLPLLEALALGKPVVCQAVTSIPEVVGAHAYYFQDSTPEELARTIWRLAADLRDMRHDGRGATEWARGFTWNRMWRDLKAAVWSGAAR